METFDIIVSIIVLLSSVVGITRGFTREILGLFSWIAALMAAYVGYPFAYKIALDYVANPVIAQYATYFAIFIVFLILFSVISNVLSSFVKQTILGGVDRILGLFFGVLRAGLLLSIAMIVMGFFYAEQNTQTFFTKSFSYAQIKMFSDELFDVLPQKVQIFIKEKRKNSDVAEVQQKGQKTPEQEKEEQEKDAQDLAYLKTQEKTEEQTDNVLNDLPKTAMDTVDSLLQNSDNVMSEVFED